LKATWDCGVPIGTAPHCFSVGTFSSNWPWVMPCFFLHL